MRFPAFGYLCRGRVLYLGVTRGYVVVATSLTTGRSEAGGSVGAVILVWVGWSARRVPAVRFGQIWLDSVGVHADSFGHCPHTANTRCVAALPVHLFHRFPPSLPIVLYAG